MNNDNHEFSTVADVIEIEPRVSNTETTGLKGRSVYSGVETTAVMGVKRKGTLSSLSSLAVGCENQIKAGLALIKSMLKSAMHEVSLKGNKLDSKLTKFLEDIYEILDLMVTMKGKLRSPLLSVAKKPRDDKVTDTVVSNIIRSVMVDAVTNTILTPN